MRKTFLLVTLTLLASHSLPAQELSLKQCLELATANNRTLQKDRLSLESACQSRREVIGALLPQLSASAGFTYNIQKTRITMPNFVNSMLPVAMRDPNADKYMSVTMGTDLSANWGVSLSQQILNFSLYNAVGIADAAEEMARTGVEITTADILAQTATLYYNVQVLDYAIGQFGHSIELMDDSRRMMGVFKDNGIIRKVDYDQMQVTKINLETEKMNLELALDVQKKLLKLQMGVDVLSDIRLESIDIDRLENIILGESLQGFDLEGQLPYKMLKSRQTMLDFQKKAAVAEVLPVLVLTGTYSNNYLGDEFKGPTYQHFPVSMVMLNMKVPIFTGFSKSAKIRKAGIEIQKAQQDEAVLSQTLTMANDNAHRQLEQNRKALEAQRLNKELAREVMSVTERNYNEGMSSLSDMLNANSSLIQAEMNYVNSLNKCIKAYIDLKKANGSILEINR